MRLRGVMPSLTVGDMFFGGSFFLRNQPNAFIFVCGYIFLCNSIYFVLSFCRFVFLFIPTCGKKTKKKGIHLTTHSTATAADNTTENQAGKYKPHIKPGNKQSNELLSCLAFPPSICVYVLLCSVDGVTPVSFLWLLCTWYQPSHNTHQFLYGLRCSE